MSLEVPHTLNQVCDHSNKESRVAPLVTYDTGTVSTSTISIVFLLPPAATHRSIAKVFGIFKFLVDSSSSWNNSLVNCAAYFPNLQASAILAPHVQGVHTAAPTAFATSKILRPDNLGDTSNSITNDNASTTNKNDLCVSLFCFDKIYCFFQRS
jgi:hypothetical protein